MILILWSNTKGGSVAIPGGGGVNCGTIEVWNNSGPLTVRAIECLDNCALCYELHPGADCAAHGEWERIAWADDPNADLQWKPHLSQAEVCSTEIRKLCGVERWAIQIKCIC